MERVVASAGAACGASLSQLEKIQGGIRATVIRCRCGEGGTVVVKALRDAPDARRAFASEAAALAFGVAGPRLLGVDTEYPQRAALRARAHGRAAVKPGPRLLELGREAKERGLVAVPAGKERSDR